MDEIHGGAAVVNVLKAFGVSQFFNVPGESFLPVLDAVGSESTLNLVTNRHEAGASFAAEGLGKMAGRPAVCMATRGPGAANLSIGIQTAFYDSTPLVALLGLIPSGLQGSGAFQEFDMPAMFGSFAKRSFIVGSRDGLEPAIAQALTEASAGRPGPVVVGIPTDLLSQSAAAAPFSFPGGDEASLVGLAPVVDELSRSKAPAFLMCTSAARGSCAFHVGETASSLGAPVYCGWRRFSAFDNSHPCFAGMLGLGGADAVVSNLAAADLVIAFGPLEQITIDTGRLNRPGLTIIQICEFEQPNLVRHLPRTRFLQVSGRSEFGGPMACLREREARDPRPQ
ncbi:thiamine pyrophosphate-binding protein [Candidatus Nephthysia bennettiae]|uniref:Acetolactate synthase n=1 Tax=Candidatus Nephthysia bennettiae TaxID=3127016 RepID=A0A934K914_9BACT|nr:hypothetical protein [Candidatus Dormibacteraeota bacterium]MBJ7614025.1 hypothetical protein [Candidatus Dormibacteraeota bacterium]